MRPIITITTDFGLDDPYVGIMKGVILSIAPDAQLVDITHQITPHDTAHAAYVLQSAYTWFPKKTIHLVVVDPGVGGERRPMAAEYANHAFVAPDNGVLTPIIKPGVHACKVTRSKYFLKSLSSTFHGRDIFAPVAAWIARGTKLSDLGQKISNPHILKLAQPSFNRNILTGQIIYKDRFGNLVSNISSEWVDRCFGNQKKISIRIGKQKTRIVSSYSLLDKGKCGGIINSWNNLEVFCREGNAANKLQCEIGDSVKLQASRNDE